MSTPPPNEVFYVAYDREPTRKRRYGDPPLSRLFRRKVDVKTWQPKGADPLSGRVFRATGWEEVAFSDL